MIKEPGIYTDISSSDYFADPCPAPSLTQSVAKILLDKSPLHAWHAHPRLNPDYQHDDDRKFDVGNIAHRLMIGRGKEITVLDFDDWRTKAAKEAREEAAAEGKLAVLGKHYAKADRMVKAACEQLDMRGLSHFFAKGDGEVVIAWHEGGMWLRQMIDWLSPDRMTFIDYKTTDMSAAPHNLSRMMVNAGWPIQAAMAARGLDHLVATKIRNFYFVVQETEPPYSLTVAEMSDDAMTMGAKQIDHAIIEWNRCLMHNRFPGYPLEICTPQYPGWHEQQWLERETHEAAQTRRPQMVTEFV